MAFVAIFVAALLVSGSGPLGGASAEQVDMGLVIASPNDGTTVKWQYDVLWTCDDPLFDRYEYRIDGGAWQVYFYDNIGINITAYGEGLHTFTLRAYDVFGDYDEEQRTFYVDLYGPNLQITSPTANPAYVNADSLLHLAWSASDNVSTVDHFDIYLNGALAIPNYHPNTVSMATSTFKTGTGESNTIVLKAYDAVGRISSASITVIKDIVNPVLTVDEPSNGAVLRDPVVRFWFNATDSNFGRYEIAYDSWLYNGLAGNSATHTFSLGVHTVRIRAWDLAGNAAMVERTFIVDNVAPAVDLSRSGTLYTRDEGTFVVEWTGVDVCTGVSFYSLKDNGVEIYNGTGTSFSLDLAADGTHQVELTAYDVAGNKGTDGFTLIIDRTPPTVTVTSPANNTVLAANSASVSWSGHDVNLPLHHYEVSVNGGDYEYAGTNTAWTFDLVEGQNVLRVKAVDRAGNEGISYLCIVADLDAPTVWFVGPAEGAVVSSDVVSWSGSDSTTAVVKYEISLNGVDWINLGGATTASLGLPADGVYVLMLRATDSGGLVSDVVTRSICYDTTNPVVNIPETSTNLIGDDTCTVAWAIIEANLDRYEVWVDSGARVTIYSGPHAFTGLPDGSHVLHVLAFDKAGNVGEDSLSIVVDNTPPTLVLLSPENGHHTSIMTLSMNWQASDASGIDHFSIRVDGSSPYNLAASVTQYSVPSLPGEHIVTLTAFDVAGHSTSVTVHIVIDTVNPSIDVLTPLAGLTNRQVTLTWRVSDNEEVDRVMLRIDGGAWQEVTNGTVLGLSDGQHLIEVRAFDPAGNNATDSVTLTLDTVSPEVTARSPVGSSVTPNANVVVSFSEAIEQGTATVVVSGVAGVKAWSSASTLVFTPSAILIAGATYNVYVNGTDLAGNVVQHHWSFVTSSNATLSGRVVDENGDPVAEAQVTLDNGTATTTTDAEGYFSFEVPPGSYTLTIVMNGYDTIVREVEVVPGHGNGSPVVPEVTLVKTKAPDLSTVVAIVAVAALAAVLVLYVLVKKRAPKKP